MIRLFGHSVQRGFPMWGKFAAHVREGFPSAGKFAAHVREGFPSTGKFAAHVREGFPSAGKFAAHVREGFPSAGKFAAQYDRVSPLRESLSHACGKVSSHGCKSPGTSGKHRGTRRMGMSLRAVRVIANGVKQSGLFRVAVFRLLHCVRNDAGCRTRAENRQRSLLPLLPLPWPLPTREGRNMPDG
jgi:hypothetical protein